MGYLRKIRYNQQSEPPHHYTYESKKDGKDQERYNQVPHLTQDTTWESNKNTINITNKSQEVSPFPAGNHKAAMNRR